MFRNHAWYKCQSSGTRVRVKCTLTCVCCATNHYQGSVYSPHFFCPFIPANMAEEEVQALAVEDGSGTCTAGFASDGASRVESPSSGADQEVSDVSDEAQSKRSVSTSKPPIEHAIVTNKRCKVTSRGSRSCLKSSTSIPSSTKFLDSKWQETRAEYIDQLCFLSCTERVSFVPERPSKQGFAVSAEN